MKRFLFSDFIAQIHTNWAVGELNWRTAAISLISAVFLIEAHSSFALHLFFTLILWVRLARRKYRTYAYTYVYLLWLYPLFCFVQQQQSIRSAYGCWWSIKYSIVEHWHSNKMESSAKCNFFSRFLSSHLRRSCDLSRYIWE